MDWAIPKTVMLISAVFGATSFFSTWTLFGASNVPINLYVINVILILVFGILPTIGLLLGWKVAYIFVKLLVGAFVIGAIGSIVLNIGFTVGLGETFDRIVLLKLVASAALALFGIALHGHLKTDEITKFFAKEI